MSKQKYHHGDVVRVDVSPKKTWKSHFPTGFTGIVKGSYGDQFGRKGTGGGYTIYPLNKEGKITDEISWYDSEDFTLISKGNEESFKKAREYEYST